MANPDSTQHQEIPELKDLQRLTRQESLIDWAIILISIGVLIYLFDALIVYGDFDARIFTAISLAMAVVIHHRALNGLFSKQKIRVRNLKKTQRVGAYSAQEIQDLASELFWPHRHKEIPAIFITKTKFEGAYVLDSLLFNFLRPLNAVYISEHIFNLLSLNEIKAILSHELGHFYHHMRPLNRVRFLLTLLHGTLPIYLSQILFGTLNAGAFIIWIIFTTYYLRGIQHWFLRVSRSHEYLSRRFGVLNFVNALIKVSKHSEIEALLQQNVLKRVQEDPRISINKIKEILQQIEECLPKEPATPEQLKRVIETVFTSEKLPRLDRPMSTAQAQRESEKIDAYIDAFLYRAEFKMIDWQEFDTEIADGSISKTEYPQLIECLKRNPEGQLFQTMSDHAASASQHSHPTVRQRILFLDQCNLPLETI